MKSQRKLFNQIPKKQSPKIKGDINRLEWDRLPLNLQRFLLLHLIRALEEYRVPTLKYSKNLLIAALSKNMGYIVQAQVIICVDTMIFQAYILDSSDQGLKLSDKVFKDLEELDMKIKLGRSNL